MIRTHKPTGHHWTCASHFQQSKQYRNLDAQDWGAPHAKTLVTDSDDKLPESLRVAKRRRVETLANDFLEGKPLFISSACASGPELSATVDNVLFERRLDWDELLGDYDEDMWADGEDGWAALKKRSKARAANKSLTNWSKASRRSVKACTSAVSNVIETPHPPGRSTTTLRPKLSTAPSEEALTMAAELRARKASLIAKTTARPEGLLSTNRQITHSAPPTARAPSSFSQCTSSRPFNPNTPADTTMADELRLSRTDSPSHRPRALTMPPESFSSETTVDDGLEQLVYGEPTATGSTAMDLCTAVQNIPSSHNYLCAGKDVEVAQSRPIATSAKSNSTWTPINNMRAQATGSEQKCHTHDGISSNNDPSASMRSAVSGTSKQSQVLATEPSAESTSQRTIRSARKSTTTKPDDSREASQRSSQSRLTGSFKASKTSNLDFVTAEKSGNGSTPFVYRKKTKSSKDRSKKSAEERSVDDEQYTKTPSTAATPKPTYSPTFPSVSVAPPTLDMSFEHSSIARALNLALVDQHVNQLLPHSPGSTRRSSSVKKALRSEMRLSGADFSRAPGEPSSSQTIEYGDQSPTSAGADQENVANTRQASKRRSTGQWPGTQVLLSKAQHDLFMSPDKVAFAATNFPTEVHSDHTELIEAHHIDDARQPMRQLSQERLPGTQALMDNWSPWSTVKKPKRGKRASFAPSPLISKDKASPTEIAVRSLRSGGKRSAPSEGLHETKQRRSSLRFSTSTAETPIALQRKPTTVTTPGVTRSEVTTSHSTVASAHSPSRTSDGSQTIFGPSPSGTGINLDLSTLSFAATAAKDATNLDDSTANWSAHDQASSFQNAQRVDADPSPEEALAEMATEFLSTADIDGVIGKV